MTLGTVSVCMTVLVLNVHHRGADSRVPPLLRRALLVHLARVVGVRTSALDAVLGRPPSFTGRDQGSSPPPGPPLTTIPGVLRRRPSLQRQRSRQRQTGSGDDARTLSCQYVPLDGVVANDVSADLTTTNTDGAPPALAGNETVRNGPSSLGLRVPCVAMSYGRRWRRQHQQLQYQRRHLLFDTTGSVVGGRLSRSGGDVVVGSLAGRSPPPSPSRPVTVDDLDDCKPGDDRGLHESSADDSDLAVNEWTEMAKVLDRTFFWLLFALMTVSAIVILLYPKYTGNEDDWTPSD